MFAGVDGRGQQVGCSLEFVAELIVWLSAASSVCLLVGYLPRVGSFSWPFEAGGISARPSLVVSVVSGIGATILFLMASVI